MRILGVDPALYITGYGLIDVKDEGLKLIEAGFIKTSSRSPIDERIKKIYLGLNKFIAVNKPDIVIIEKLYAHFNHPTTAFILGHARGAVCLAASILNVPIVEFAATKVKKSITGFGRASKIQVKRMICNCLGLKNADWPEDVSDALALAVTFANYNKHQKIIQI